MADFTIASKIVPPTPINPLDLIGKIQGVQGQQLQNKLLGQNIEQTLAQRAAARGSIDPETGQTDPDKYSAALATGGASSDELLKAQQMREGKIRTAIASQGLSQQQLKTSEVENGNVVQLDQAIRATGDTSKANVIKMVDEATPSYFKSPDALKAVQQFKAQLSDDPAANDALLKQHALTHGTVAKVLGELQSQDVGSNFIQGRADTATGAFSPTAVIGKGLSPSEAQTPAYTYTDPNTGQTHIVTKAEAAAHAAGAASGPPSANGAPNGRYPSAGGPPTGIVSGMKPGSSGVMEDSAKTYLADAAAIPNIKRTMTTFDQAFDAMKTAKTGPGSEHLQNLRGIADTYHIPLPFLGNKNETESYVEANKWLTSALTSEAQRLGLGTDAARALQGEAQPGVHTVQGAAIAMIPVLKGLKAMDMVAPLIAKQQGWTPQNYVEKRGEWANSVDPLAFGADLMPASQRKALIDKMKPDQKARYVKGLRSAVDAGLFTFDDLGK